MAQNKERTGKPALMKELNTGLIMDALQNKGQATRVELAALTNLSQPTVNMLIGELVKERAVISLGIARSTGGRRAELFAINSKRAALAAVLIKKDMIEAVVTDLELHMELHEKRPLTEGVSCTEELLRLLSMLFEKRPEIRAICVGVPGSVSAGGEVFSIPTIPEWEHFSLKEYLESRFPASVCIMNDMNAIAAGYLLGGQEHAQSFVYLHAEGAGMGAGIVIDGKVYSGFRSFAGEVGSMLLGKAVPDSGREASEPGAGTSTSVTDGETDIEGELHAGREQGAGREPDTEGELDTDRELDTDGELDTDREPDTDGELITGREPDTDGELHAGGEVHANRKLVTGTQLHTAVGAISVEGLMLSDAEERNRTAILTSTVVNLICVLNPEEILFGGDITEEMMRDICEGCRAYLPESVLPLWRFVSDYMEDYINGLCRQGREMLSRHIRIV